MNGVLEKIEKIGIVPVVVLDDPKDAKPLAEALIKGGLPCAEVTFRTAAAEESIKRMTESFPEMLVGAGTVLTTEQADRAINAGAKFIVAPGLNPTVVKHCINKGIPMVPGVNNPSDIEAALELGLDVVKFFPAEQNGGVAKLRALAGPYKNLKWMPTGGVNTGNLVDYLSFHQVLACGGTWMVKKDLIEGEKWDEITGICRAAVKNMLGLELKHIGINSENEEEAAKTAKTLCALFGLEYKPGNSSIFAGKEFEIMKSKGRGTNGHIAIAAWDVDRAIYHLSRNGASFDESTRSADEKGTKVIYLEGEFGGFAIHLARK